MITYEAALAIAKSKKPQINKCDEYEDAYIFDYLTGVETFGGAGPCVVMKDTGRAVNMTAYAVKGKHKTLLRSFDI